MGIEGPKQNLDQKQELPRGRADQTLADYFTENGLEVPPVEIMVFFSGHGTEAEGALIEPYYKDCDVYVPERSGWLPESLQKIKDAAKGGDGAKQINQEWIDGLKDRYAAGTFKVMRKYSGKEACIMDLPSHSRNARKISESRKAMSAKDAQISSRLSLADAADIKAQNTEEFAKYDDMREQEMISNLPMQLGQLIRSNPELSKKQKIKVLITLGSSHTRLYHWLKDRGENVEREFSAKPHEFHGAMALITRSKYFGKELTPEIKQLGYFVDTLCMQTFFGYCLTWLPPQEYEQYLSKILKALTYEKIPDIYKDLMNGSTKSFEQALLAKGVPLTNSRADVPKTREWLAQQRA